MQHITAAPVTKAEVDMRTTLIDPDGRIIPRPDGNRLLVDAYNVLHRDYDRVKSEEKILKEEVASLRSQLYRMRNATETESASHVQRLAEDRAALQERVVQLEGENQQLRAAKGTIASVRTSLAEFIAMLFKGVATEIPHAEKDESHTSTLESELKALQRLKDRILIILTTAVTEHRRVEAANKQLEAQQGSSSGDVALLRLQLDEMQGRCAILEAAMDTKWAVPLEREADVARWWHRALHIERISTIETTRRERLYSDEDTRRRQLLQKHRLELPQPPSSPSFASNPPPSKKSVTRSFTDEVVPRQRSESSHAMRRVASKGDGSPRSKDRATPEMLATTYLGITFDPSSPPTTRVAAVSAEAAAAGITAGDQVVGVESRSITTPLEFVAGIMELKGTTAKVKVKRGSSTRTCEIKLKEPRSAKAVNRPRKTSGTLRSGDLSARASTGNRLSKSAPKSK